MSSRTFACFFLFLIALASLTGCTVNQYATPRTLKPGQVSHTVAVEGFVIGLSGEPGDLHPRYQIRVGLANRVDLGVMLGPFFGADVKLNFVRTKRVDMAWSPGIHYGMFPSSSYGWDAPTHIVRFSGPLSIGFNVTKATTIFVHGNVSPIYRARNYDEHCFPSECELSTWAVTPEVGLGVQLRLTPSIALTPEVSFIGPAEHLMGAGLHGGIGVSFGAQPNYNDVDERPRD